MAYEGYTCLDVRVDRGVAFVTIDHPPINLFDLALMRDIATLGPELEADDQVRAMVFQSANPDFFIAHADVNLIQQLPREVPPRSDELSGFHRMVDAFRTMGKASIGVIEGIARGGGSEFLLSLDMRFAARDRAKLGQPEVALGILPGGSGTQRLPRLMGRAHALEAILGCGDYSAEEAERYGWVNRALPPDEVRPFAHALAYRIASFPHEAVALAKQAVNAAEKPTVEGLLDEAHCFNQTLATDAAQIRMQRFMEIGGQTRDAELNLETILDKLSDLG